jgi:hypothetical protein
VPVVLEDCWHARLHVVVRLGGGTRTHAGEGILLVLELAPPTSLLLLGGVSLLLLGGVSLLLLGGVSLLLLLDYVIPGLVPWR